MLPLTEPFALLPELLATRSTLLTPQVLLLATFVVLLVVLVVVLVELDCVLVLFALTVMATGGAILFWTTLPVVAWVTADLTGPVEPVTLPLRAVTAF